MTELSADPGPWTPWIDIICANEICRRKVKREWPHGNPLPPRFCSPQCARSEKRRRQRPAYQERKAQRRSRDTPAPTTQVVTVVCAYCFSVVQRDWYPGASEIRYCSQDHARRGARQQRERKRKERVAARDSARCEHPEKKAYLPSMEGTRKAARDAVRLEKYIYACRCDRFHLTSRPDPSVPLPCVDPRESYHDRWRAWHEFLLPAAQKLRARRAINVTRINRERGL